MGLTGVVSLRHLKLATQFLTPAWIWACTLRVQAARSDVTVLVDRPAVNSVAESQVEIQPSSVIESYQSSQE